MATGRVDTADHGHARRDSTTRSGNDRHRRYVRTPTCSGVSASAGWLSVYESGRPINRTVREHHGGALPATRELNGARGSAAGGEVDGETHAATVRRPAALEAGGGAAVEQATDVGPLLGPVGRAAQRDDDVAAVGEVDVGPAQGGHLAAPVPLAPVKKRLTARASAAAAPPAAGNGNIGAGEKPAATVEAELRAPQWAGTPMRPIL